MTIANQNSVACETGKTGGGLQQTLAAFFRQFTKEIPHDPLEARVARLENLPLCRCSFCGKSHSEVVKLIAGPQAFICDECIWISLDVIVNGSGK